MYKGLILFLLPIVAFSQPSWVSLELQTDSYGEETTWQIYMVGSDNAFASGGPYADSSYTEEMILLPSGEYNLVVDDAFGDGICCEFGEGWFGLSNDCGLDVSVFDFNTSQITVPFIAYPCALPVYGCTDDSSNNYNPWATIDDESCNVSECPDGEAFVSMALTLDNWPNETGFTLVDLAAGEFYEQVLPGGFNFGDQLVTYTYDFCVALGFELILTDTYGDGLNGSASGGEDGSVVITACDDEIVWELEDLSYSDNDGNVHYSGAVFVEECEIEEPIVGCMDDDYVDYNPQATQTGDCTTIHTWGCMDPESFNYDSTATISDLNSPCVTTIRLGDAAGDGWGNSHIGIKQGELNWIFTIGPDNFSESWDLILDSDEKVDVYYFEIGSPQQPPQETEFQTLHNSVLITNEAGDTLLAEGLNPFFDNGKGALQPFKNPEWNVYSFMPYCGTSCVPFMYGCTDSVAQNYNAEANTEDGSCYYSAGCTQAGYLEYYIQGYEADFDDGSCSTLVVFGCTDAEAFNFDSEANVDNSTCVDFVYGCLDESSFTYNPLANTNDNSCCYVDGCTNAEALNYNEDACYDDGSCVEVIEGCMDLDAYNFEPLANVPDNDNCLYDAGCVTGPGNPYWLNDQCYAWVISVDPYCCESDWDGVCVELYEYCGQTVSSVDLMVESMLHIFPNPTSGVVNIQAPVGTIIKIFDAVGREVMTTSNNRVELPASGVYTIVANYKGRIKTERIVRQ